jgi:two-component system chemotaxis response regulator CheB
MPLSGQSKGPTRVFLVDDSPLALVLLKRMLATSPDIEVVGTARNGREALAMFESTQPQVICTDYLMPDMDGLALIQQTMEVFPRPILVISSAIDPAERQQAFPLLAAGAVDVLAKPSATDAFEQTATELVQKIKLISGVSVISRRSPVSAASGAVSVETRMSRPPLPAPLSPPVRSAVPPSNNGSAGARPVLLPHKANLIRMVAVGASTGGPQVIQAIFNGLPANFSCPVVCVQHISPGFLNGLVEWLASQCRVRVKIAENGELARPGTVYFPPENFHLEMDKQGHLIYSGAPPLDGHRPSVTATFESAARSYGHSALGILLTGMGSDGASGLESIMRAGGTTMAQDEASCVVFGMPKQAIERGAAHFVLPPLEITQTLIRLVSSS